ncbi:ATP-binding protein [Marinagarivorans cellulosilyticus]|uniref:AAA-ATPase-like domain-containing protein n=1 Tax=Marinagarivorans cellulosilyticus TaxID=2721545 RepID=A0AAN1WEQ8_9GAMM|nr:ATP-binding protein [Marinagarivorans cellulosilyticus]BCD96238.1 hypothetical protein MARGE09_P0437 [Marinagarivorans cellulosilyticus]
MATKRKLPTGIQSFVKLRNEGCYYVDKTPYMHQLITQGNYFFLSRPRRFGKSLFLDTLQQLFEARRELFSDLFIEKKWDWQTAYPVVRFSFGDGVVQGRAALNDRINQQLSDNRERLGLPANTALDIPGNFRSLLMAAHKKYGQGVVLLIDEYDKPILDNIENTEIATQNREGLKNLYSVIKDADPFLKFVLLTGVSKFSKVSLFSGLNNLNDITLDAKYSAICGYTDNDIDEVFEAELAGLDRDKIREWYNGYNWLGTSVYNPFDVLLLLEKREFKPYWFESATPTFLIKKLGERQINTLDLAALHSDQDLLGHFDVDAIGTEALLFQTGYLTIAAVDEPIPGIWEYTLSYPNVEVEVSLNKALLPTQGFSISAVTKTRSTLLKALKSHDFELLSAHLKALYASIPHDWYRNNPINNYEGHYASIFYSHFAALGLHVTVEDSSVNGKVDMAIQFNNTTFIFEFKVVEDKPLGNALAQIKANNYAQKYVRDGWAIYGIGVEFSKAQRQVVALEAQVL